MGTGSVIRPGDAQKMTAGTGIQHSEFNPSKTDAVHLLQIWIEPEKRGLKPTYEQKAFPVEARRGKLCLIGSRDGRDGSITIQQDVSVYATILGKDESVHHESAPDRFCWVQVAKGGITLNGQALAEGTAPRSPARRRSRWRGGAIQERGRAHGRGSRRSLAVRPGVAPPGDAQKASGAVAEVPLGAARAFGGIARGSRAAPRLRRRSSAEAVG